MNRHFDILAPLYDRAIPPPDPDWLAELLRLPADGWLLDAGGGTGRVSAGLRSRVGRLVITDLSAPMLAQAQAKQVACAVQAHVERLPFADGQFDRVVVVDALHHFANQTLAVGELARLLKPGGRLVIEEPDILQPRVKMMALGEKLALMGSHFHTPQHIQLMLIGAGLTAEVVSDGGASAWIVGDKPHLAA
ncbi:MAG TPA: methyltransferase domain-containing protein [Anaerolineae bacterium]|nr:methyltransferase domain-containing protein [Anaerolineae bacterium]